MEKVKYHHSEEIKKKIGLASKNRIITEETRKRLREAMLKRKFKSNYKLTEEDKRKNDNKKRTRD